MRQDLIKLNELKCSVIACTMDLEVIHKDLYAVNHDYQILKDEEKELIFNINFLKKDKVTVVAQEFKRSVEELDFVQRKLLFLDKSYTSLIKNFVKLEKKQSELMEEYNRQLQIVNDYQVVVPFDQSRRKRALDEK